ncbi:MAG: type II toxin-antitoxin system Phd/YefM family antitoxin [Blastocatellia bacterium]
MKKIIPITDLQRQAGQIVSGFDKSAEPIIITQRGRAAAVIISVARYEEIEEDLARLDELELREMLILAEAQIAAGQTISHKKVKERMAQRMKAASSRDDSQHKESRSIAAIQHCRQQLPSYSDLQRAIKKSQSE